MTWDIPDYSASLEKANQQLGKTVTISEAVAKAAAPRRKTDAGTNHTGGEEWPRSAELLPGVGPVTDGEAPSPRVSPVGNREPSVRSASPELWESSWEARWGPTHLTRITGDGPSSSTRVTQRQRGCDS